MIIQCRQCATKFRFNDELMTGDGVWVRCGRCGHEFFEINTRWGTLDAPAHREPSPDRIRDASIPESEAVQFQKEIIQEAAAGQKPVASPKALTPAEVVVPPALAEVAPEEDEEPDEDTEEERPRSTFWTPSRLALYSIFVLLVVTGVYLWQSPSVGRDVMNFVYQGSGDRMLGPATKATPVATPGGIHFGEVKERFTKSTAAGDLLVISGLAVNEFEYPVGRIKLRSRLVDQTGKLLGEIETYAGNLLNDDELNRLTDKEILSELQRQEGSDMPNTNIRARASIPFMIVFANPPKEVDEFIIELSGVERSTTSN